MNKASAPTYHPSPIRKLRAAIASAAFAATASLAFSATATTKLPTLSAHIPFDEGKGDIANEVISGTKGALVDMDSADSWVKGVNGRALHFDGENDHVVIPHHAAFDFGTEDFTVSFMMRWPKGVEPGHEHLFTKGDYEAHVEGETGKRWELTLVGGRGVCFVIDDDINRSSILVPFDAFITGEWIHVAAVRDGAAKRLRLYVDGVSQESLRPHDPYYDGLDRVGNISNPQSLYIGDASRVDNPFLGEIDDIRIYRAALSPSQIAIVSKISGHAPGAKADTNPVADASRKPRVIVTSDGEIDDQCSMIRFLLYANEWDIEGIITSSSQYHWQGHKWAGDDWIDPDLDAYEKVYPNLLKHDAGFPTPEYLRSITLLGNVKAEGEMEEVTAGSQLIVKVLLDESDDRPIWLQAWGGTNTIARALKTIEEKHPEKMEYVATKIRLYLIWEQDATYQEYIKPNWGKFKIPTIISDQFISYFYAWKEYLPENEKSYLAGSWMNEHIIKGHGPLTAEYKAHVGEEKKGFVDGDFRSEGDSPAFLHNILTGLRNMESPEWGGWGGRYVNVRDSEWLDPVLEAGYEYPSGRWYTSTAWGRQRLRKKIPNDAELTEYLKPTWRWIEAIQNDFASRADWCFMPYENANHPPLVLLDHHLDRDARRGRAASLSAKGSSDPDGDTLSYHWWQYKEADTYQGTIEIQNATEQNASFVVPEDAQAGETIHIVCEVTDSGTPALTRYQRVVFTVR